MWAIGIVVSDLSFREYRALADAPVPITIGNFSHHQSDLVVVAASNTETREVSCDLTLLITVFATGDRLSIDKTASRF